MLGSVVLSTLVGYLSGSCLAAPWICRWAGVADPRSRGSCNPGFSNMLRLYGIRLALMTLVLDAAKGVPAVLSLKLLGGPVWAQGIAGAAVLLGHSYPVWHRFRGGKSVASAFGVLLVLAPAVALGSAALWSLLAWRLKTAAMASLASAMAAPLLCLWWTPRYIVVVGGFSLLIVARHWLNIRRMGRGTEPSLRRQRPGR
ncbi:glycerol-3-phosphate acyltransferase [Halomonas sp. Bachu 37]